MAYEPPPFMPYEPALLGVGVVFNLLTSDAVGNVLGKSGPKSFSSGCVFRL